MERFQLLALGLEPWYHKGIAITLFYVCFCVYMSKWMDKDASLIFDTLFVLVAKSVLKVRV